MNNFLPIQILLSIFLVFAASRVVLRVKEGNISFGFFLFWFGLWILAGFAIINPGSTTYLAKQIGIGRGTDAVIYASLVLLFYLLFRTNVIIENLKHEITKLTTEIAIKEKKEDENTSDN